MEASKDYYAILGVLSIAEEVVIRAAYKALAQRYHPDRSEGSQNGATLKMQEINEAYAILSDKAKRAEYDMSRGKQHDDGESYFGFKSDEPPPTYDPLEADWAVAVRYYPDLVELERRLATIAWRLGYSFRAYIVEEKAYSGRLRLADEMERQFMMNYFGTDPAILDFAQMLVRTKEKRAAKALSDAVRVVGGHIHAQQLITQIKAEFLPDMVRAENEARQHREEMARRQQEEAARRLQEQQREAARRFQEQQRATSMKPAAEAEAERRAAVALIKERSARRREDAVPTIIPEDDQQRRQRLQTESNLRVLKLLVFAVAAIFVLIYIGMQM